MANDQMDELEGSIDFLGRPSFSKASPMLEFYNSMQVPLGFYSPSPTHYSTDECVTPEHSFSEYEFETPYQQSAKSIVRQRNYFTNRENGSPPVDFKMDRVGPTSAYVGHDSTDYSPTQVILEADPASVSSTESHFHRNSQRRVRSGFNGKPRGDDNIKKILTKKGSSELNLRTPPKKRKQPVASKAEKPKVPRLDRPLSELTKNYVDLPVRDMESWVHRSTEERIKEVEKRDGHVARPMNSFMLYRSAFAERTKQWCLQNNHQVVSSVSGASWPLEPAWIREKYNELARIERINHQAAHPGYKFSPSKNQTPRIRRRKHFSDGEDETGISSSEAEDLGQPELGPVQTSQLITKKRKQRSNIGDSKKSIPFPDRAFGSPEALAVISQDQYRNLNVALRLQKGAQKSSYQVVNPGRPAPTSMASNETSGTYYQTIVRPAVSANVGNSMVEDVTIRKTATPAMAASFIPGEKEETRITEEYTPYQQSTSQRLSQEPIVQPKQELSMMEPNFWVCSQESTPEADFEQYRDLLLDQQAQNITARQALMLTRGELIAPYPFVSPGLVYSNIVGCFDLSDKATMGVNYTNMGSMWHSTNNSGNILHGDYTNTFHYDEWITE
ncbi:hypothetical protein H072_3206 [Dactylellina haptotyla CBS 200.50]|uniref:HMG box domain-containing protein n=1 Tax=Dactylellina haptotyla (strain CBS 200.50) TaxID=1284197 RepID=S8AIY6_DACHA|nr:hypothetical protein H072_3206 [Dactylellina haptotyla CBS 200.50]